MVTDSMELGTFRLTIIYATSVKQMSDFYIFQCCEKPTLVKKVDMFHSETSAEKKVTLLKSFRMVTVKLKK